jgi:N-acetylglucosamine-6-sulfatase
VPFIVRGPGVGKGWTTDAVTSHVDLAAMFLGMAGVEEAVVRGMGLDGAGVPWREEEVRVEGGRHEHVNVESWGIIMSEGKYGAVLYPNHTYKALRVVGREYNLVYTVWCSGEKELYDLNVSQSTRRKCGVRAVWLIGWLMRTG